MKIWKFKLLISSFLLSLSLYSNIANAYISNIDPYYAGVEYKGTYVDSKKEWGSIFTASHPGPAFFCGGRWDNCWFFSNLSYGLEFGYSWTVNKARTTFIPNGATFLGVRNDSGVGIRATGKARFKSGYMDLKAYVPIPVPACFQCFYPELIFAIGAASSKVVLDVVATPHPIPAEPQFNLSNQLNNIKGATRSTLRAGVGFQAMFWDYWGVRAMARWEQFSRLRAARSQGLESFPANRSLFGNGYSFSLGLYCTFPPF